MNALKNSCFTRFQPDLLRVREYLERLAPRESEFVARMATYFLTSKGQLLRPCLVIACSRINGEPNDNDRPVAVGALVELIHAASLLHDDVIDQGRFRRKMRTINSLWGNKEAVLLGDFVLARALGILADYPDRRILGSAARITYSLSVGELVELEHVSDVELMEREYEKIISLKTADFFRECCFLGGVAGDASEGDLESLSELGHELGMAYQILDDLLDVTAASHSLGKETIIDVMNGNLTLPMIHCLRSNGPGRFGDKIRRAFEEKDHDFFKAQLPSIVRETGAYDFCLERSRVRTKRAQDLLSRLEGSHSSEIQGLFSEFIEYMYRRLDVHQVPGDRTPPPRMAVADEPEAAR